MLTNWQFCCHDVAVLSICCSVSCQTKLFIADISRFNIIPYRHNNKSSWCFLVMTVILWLLYVVQTILIWHKAWSLWLHRMEFISRDNNNMDMEKIDRERESTWGQSSFNFIVVLRPDNPTDYHALKTQPFYFFTTSSPNIFF